MINELINDPMMTTKEVAAMLKISPSTLDHWRSQGKYAKELPYSKLGRSVRYRKSVVQNFARLQERGQVAA